jgi:hypothetical protein
MSLELQAELEQITRAQEKLKKRLEGVINAMNAIAVLAQESDEPIVEPSPLSEDEEQGFTDHVRAILKANPTRAFAAIEIRDLILERDQYADPKITLIHTHNTLKRLFRQEEVLETQMPDRRTGYKWQHNHRPIADLMAALKKSLAETESRMAASSPVQSATKRLKEKVAEMREGEETGKRVRVKDIMN